MSDDVDARKELALAPAWQAIETAPKDGTEVLLWVPKDDCAWLGSYTDFESVGGAPSGYHNGWFDSVTGHNELDPMCWMPLPAPPSTGAPSRKESKPSYDPGYDPHERLS